MEARSSALEDFYGDFRFWQILLQKSVADLREQ
jgi:hypothetical protein